MKAQSLNAKNNHKKNKKNAVLKSLEKAFNEAKEIRDGKKEGLTLEQIFLAY